MTTPTNLSELNRLIRGGEGKFLEFKRKANHPEKIAREMVAFANTEGGILLVGVDDDHTVYGVKYPEEDIFAIESFLQKHCRPRLEFTRQNLAVSYQREVLVYRVSQGRKKPYFLYKNGKKETFVRNKDMSIVASPEMIWLLRSENRNTGVSIRFGDREKALIQYLESVQRITIEEAQKLLNIRRRQVSGLLVLLVRAGLLSIHPSEKGDYFCLVPEAFE